MTSHPAHHAADALHPVVRRIIIVVLLITILAPLTYMLILSVTPDVEIAGGVVFPTQLKFGNYVAMWTDTGISSGLVNSVIVCGLSSIAAVLVGAVAGYVSSRVRFVGRGVFMSMLLAFQSVPTVMTLLPLFIVMAGLQSILHTPVIGTYGAVTIAYLTFALPLVTWFIASYVEGIPRDLEEAARLDGAGAFRIFGGVILPLIAPAAAVAGLLSFMTGWGDLLIASVLSGPTTRTVAVSLQSFLNVQSEGSTPAYGPLMAASVISALPIVVLYAFLQRYVVAGLTSGGVKG